MTRTFAGTIVLTCTLACDAAVSREQTPGQDSAWVAQIASEHRCEVGTVVVKPSVDFRNCALAMAARHEIRAGHGAEFGISAADTANIAEIEVFERDYGEPDGLYWIANVTIRGKETGLVVLFERTKKRITVTSREDWGLQE